MTQSVFGLPGMEGPLASITEEHALQRLDRGAAEGGLARRIAAHGVAPGRTEEEYRERLAFELGVDASRRMGIAHSRASTAALMLAG